MRWTFQTGRSKRNDKFPTCSTLMDCNRRDSVSVLSRVVFLPELMAKFISECSHVVQEYFGWQMTSLGHLEAGQTGALSLSPLWVLWLAKDISKIDPPTPIPPMLVPLPSSELWYSEVPDFGFRILVYGWIYFVKLIFLTLEKLITGKVMPAICRWNLHY